MSSCWGRKIRISLFGESHGSMVGAVIDGLPPGIAIREDALRNLLDRRKPGTSSAVTPRKESDEYQVTSGLLNGFTTGSPLCVMFHNLDTSSKDYGSVRKVPRPGHADYTAHVKYRGFQDVRGGGHFSGRLTAPLVFAGGLVMQILEERGIRVVSHLLQVLDILDDPLDSIAWDPEIPIQIAGNPLPMIRRENALAAWSRISEVQKEGDSAGGRIETGIYGIPAGMGEPFFQSVESTLSALVFSIPGVKGISFGEGAEFPWKKGSETNDGFLVSHGEVRTATNRMGGILGGITNGMPVIFRTAVKPTPSIALPQDSVDLGTMEAACSEIRGRHDPCIAVRMVPVMEACAALGMYELMED